ncbi:hypothetical protein MUP65_02880, partial [Patescibacteria group bacterium]|nr:hypothetical protein [Patescibacteria group bacterium]
KKVTAKELEKAKSYLTGRLALALEDSFNVASRAALETLIRGRVRSYQEMVRKIMAVSAGDVQQVAKKYLSPNQWNLAVVGPFRDQEMFTKIIKS